MYPLFDDIQVDVNKLIIRIVHPVKEKHDFTLLAPSKAIFDSVLEAFQLYMNANERLREQGIVELEVDESGQSKHDKDADEHVTLIERPKNGSSLETVLWASVLPIRYAMHFTLPDVRHLDYHGDVISSVGYAYLSTITCLIWLIFGENMRECALFVLYCGLIFVSLRLNFFTMVPTKSSGSYAMVASLEDLAEQIGISNAIMGVTLSAAGTSLPAYIASRIAGEFGLITYVILGHL